MSNSKIIIKTLKVRVRNKHIKELNRQAVSVNFVWNYINNLSFRSIKEYGNFLSAFDIHPYTKGANKELGLHSQTLQMISKEYVNRRNQFKKKKLKWRKTFGSHRSLGWIPINTGVAEWKSGQVYFNGKYYKVWDSYGLSQYKFKTASFNEDGRGRWYFNVTVEVSKKENKGTESVGIDLGCKDAATCSNGDKLSGHWYKEKEKKLAKAQRANKKKEVKNIHAKIKNRRQDSLHKFSRKLVDNNAAIFVGNVNAKSLAKTKVSKSALDAGWSMFKTMLKYKCDHAGVVFEIINESYTTQTCSDCGLLPNSRPKGITSLGIREWTCSECGVSHDRDINAARNILALGHQRLAGGISRHI